MNTVNVKITEGGFLGSRNLIFSVFLRSDGASGELVNYTLIDPVDLGLTRAARFGLVRMDHNFAGFSAIIQFDSGGVTPTQKWVLVDGPATPIDFTKVGPIKDDSGVDGTGKLQITTSGFTSAADFGSIMFKLRMP